MKTFLKKYWSWRVLILAVFFAVGIASLGIGSLLVWQALPGHYPPVTVGEKGPFDPELYACNSVFFERAYQCTAGQFWSQVIRLIPVGVAYLIIRMLFRYQLQSVVLIAACYIFLLWMRKMHYTQKNINAVLDRLPKWMDFR